MGLSNAAGSDLLKLLFQNAAWANFGDASGLQPSATPGNLYIALHNADPTAAGDQTSHETAYTNYARLPVARSSAGFTVSGTTQVANALALLFATCGVTGDTITHFSIGRASAGTGEILASGALSSPLVVATGVAPTFNINQLVGTAA